MWDVGSVGAGFEEARDGLRSLTSEIICETHRKAITAITAIIMKATMGASREGLFNDALHVHCHSIFRRCHAFRRNKGRHLLAKRCDKGTVVAFREYLQGR